MSSASIGRLRLLRVVCVAAAAAAAGLVPPSASAQQAPGSVPAAAAGPDWQALSPAQQQALQPLKRDWAGIDAPRKQKWLEIVARFPTMPPEERERVQARMAEWARLSPAERGQARLQFQEVRQMNPQDRAAAWDAYLALPAEQRRALAQRAKTVPRATPEARAGTAAAPPNQKANPTIPPAKPVTATAVASTLVHASPGATTTLISKAPNPPAQQQPGGPKIAAPSDRLDRKTLLPRTAALAAPASAAPSAAAPAAAQQQPAAASSTAAPPAGSPAAAAEAAPGASAEPSGTSQ